MSLPAAWSGLQPYLWLLARLLHQTCVATLIKMVRDHLPAEMRLASDTADLLMSCCNGVYAVGQA
jgi:hypothetical protein